MQVAQETMQQTDRHEYTCEYLSALQYTTHSFSQIKITLYNKIKSHFSNIQVLWQVLMRLYMGDTGDSNVIQSATVVCNIARHVGYTLCCSSVTW